MKIELPPLPPVEAFKVIADFEQATREHERRAGFNGPDQPMLESTYRSEHTKMLLRLTGTKET
jgi:hypothetical protein